MSQPRLALLASSIAATLVLAFATPAGTAAPTLIRTVHLNGVAGPAYYSVVDGGYRPVRLRPVVAEAHTDRVAENTAPASAQ